MKRDTITQNIDSINKHLTNISYRLDNIEDKIAFESLIRTFLTPILVGLIVGLVIFILTKKKEILFKKAEVAGEIFMRLYELKKIRNEYSYHLLNRCAYDACIRLHLNDNINIDYIKSLFEISENDIISEIEIKREKLFNELMKYVGQYKFYITNKEDKIKLDQKIVVLQLKGKKYDLFENCNSISEVCKKHEQLLIENYFVNNFELKIQEVLDEIEKIINKT